MPSAAPKRRFALYAVVNLAFLVIVAATYAMGDSQNPRFLYLCLLFALCSTPIIDLDGFNGRHALLALFSLVYFVMFGVSDLSALAEAVAIEHSEAILSAAEAVVLVGGLASFLSYRVVISITSRVRENSDGRDWSRQAVLIAGFLMWAIGTWATYQWYVYIVTDTTNDVVRKGLQNLGTYQATAYVLAQMLQPLGILLIAYAWRMYWHRALLLPILAICALQVVLGFVADVKGLAMLGGILVIVTMVLIDEKIPKWWLAGGVLYVIIVFPIFQAYRAEIHGNRGMARTDVVANFGKVLALTLSAQERVNTGHDRAQSFLERSSLLGNVQMIVEKAGGDVPYQHGYTLTPILATFVPKIVWSDKPDIPTGQLINSEFHLSDSDIYISPSHLGELYWNYGWSGVIVGMAIIGSILGFVGGCFNLAQRKTVTRLLVTVVTIKQLVTGFESAIAPSYVVWLRSMAGIGLLHLTLARVPVAARWLDLNITEADDVEADEPDRIRPLPNLLR
jgi:hypothetical protein